jgi:2-methylisocitrate lyase-like PEP mutase family enzyme
MKEQVIDLGYSQRFVNFAELNKILNKNGYELKDIRSNPEEEKLMTREEAVKKINTVVDINYDSINHVLIAKLEALGLIKFKEKKKKRFEMYNPARDEVITTDRFDDVNNWLMDGFRILKDNG